MGSEGETQAEGKDNKQHCVHSSPSVTPLHANSAGIHCVLNTFKRYTDDIIDKHCHTVAQLTHLGQSHAAQPIKSHHVTAYLTHSSTSVALVEGTVYKYSVTAGKVLVMQLSRWWSFRWRQTMYITRPLHIVSHLPYTENYMQVGDSESED